MDPITSGTLAVAAAVLTGVLTAPATAEPVGDFDVRAYDIDLSYEPDTGTLRATTVIDAKATETLDSVTLDLSGPTVRSVTVDKEPASFTQPSGLVIEPPTPIDRGDRFRLRVEYDGEPGPGWLPTTTGGATAFMGNSSAWFPVHADARDKASFDLTATVPSGWGVVSIGREIPVPGDTTFRWRERSVDPAHIAVSVDRFTFSRATLPDGTPVVNAYADGLRDTTEPLADRLPEILGFLSGKFGDYPFRSAGNVFVHVNDDGPATAPQTRPVYLGAGNEQFMTLNAVVHEQAHQWYGISVAPRAPADMCVSECFAVYATWLWDEAKSGADLDARYRKQVTENKDDEAFWGALYRPGQNPGINIYDKGPLALHALRHQVGDKAFFHLLERWPTENAGDYADWPTFEAFAERTTGQELTAFFQSWIHASTIPADEHLWPGALRP